jgi:hypothetical protein
MVEKQDMLNAGNSDLYSTKSFISSSEALQKSVQEKLSRIFPSEMNEEEDA